jgi:hypothetical protein
MLTADALIASASNTVLTVLTKAGAAVDEIQSVESMVVTMVNYAETTGKDGATKLKAVLAAVQSYVADALPNLKVQWSALEAQVKSFVAGLVSLWNALGVFVKDVKGAISGAQAAIQGAQ